MHTHFAHRLRPILVAIAALTASASDIASAQAPDLAAAMHWRQIGPGRAGRARALSGVATQPNTFYAGFDNGGVWRSTDYGANWVPLFDKQSTGSIGAIAVAPSNPNVIYVGTGAGIIRPDLATGDGVYKSTDAGKTWTNLGLRESQMIAMIDVDPKDPNRFFVAVLGHPYGPNPERGIFRSTDGGKSFQKVLYKDEYTSANDVRIDPTNPNIVYATLWQQQQSFIEGQAFGGAGNGIFKSTDGGTTWKQLTEGLPPVIQANIALAPSNASVLYAMVAGASPNPNAPPTTTGAVAFYKSTDRGDHWALAVAGKRNNSGGPLAADARPMGRIGGGDLPTIVVDPSNENVVYSASTVMWRTEDGGVYWSAVRGAPGGDDYQKIWVNPLNPDIVLAVADQGAVVSANRGESWSNWYNQSTAAMYHVSTDFAFPYRVCGGQQDSGSACVESRSMDGELTFRNWAPVNIQEYGIAASDPRDPDKVFGSQRSNVSLFDRRTGQSRTLGPDMSARAPDGNTFNRNVRTMPLLWSPVNPDALYYASNAVWKTNDRGANWKRISPDLARATWAVPANAGKYAVTVRPSPTGTITGLSLSPRTESIIWAGTDDGNIQVTVNGGISWTNVTPATIKPWTRIFNIEAGHFDALTAYAAANTMRLDDMNPHFLRTHDGGKTWTEINTGLSAGSVANSIREDPRVKGLLYASTDTQVWVSFDDGDHWESLRIDMPAISVRDLQVKDDSTCLCADLVAATHGRGFYILDNLTPLRQAAAARAAQSAYLVKPAPAVRVRFATNDPTPLPPEVPAGENPPPGAVIDYYLAANARTVTLEIVDAAGKILRSYSSADTATNPHPGVDPVAYNKMCQQHTTALNCGLPLYWQSPPMLIGANKGMHRFSWDMRFDPIETPDGEIGGGEDATGAVPHRTYPDAHAPWVAAGTYSVRLTVDGTKFTQPITVRMDPRVKTSAAELTRLATLSRALYDEAVSTYAAFTEARKLSTSLASQSEKAALRAGIDSIAPATAAPGGGRGGGGGGGFGGGGGAPPAPTLDRASAALLAAAMTMQNADVAPTARDLAAATAARAQATTAMARWTKYKAMAAKR
ncbi:MAG: glycoside hydrolase [Gemmatimonadaceae bacterium]